MASKKNNRPITAAELKEIYNKKGIRGVEQIPGFNDYKLGDTGKVEKSRSLKKSTLISLLENNPELYDSLASDESLKDTNLPGTYDLSREYITKQKDQYRNSVIKQAGMIAQEGGYADIFNEELSNRIEQLNTKYGGSNLDKHGVSDALFGELVTGKAEQTFWDTQKAINDPSNNPLKRDGDTKDKPAYKRQDRNKYFSKGDQAGINAAEDQFVEWYSDPATRRRFPGGEKELDKGVQKALDTKAFASFDIPDRGDAVYYKGAPQYGVDPQIRLENTSGDVFQHELVHATQFDDALGSELRNVLGDGTGNISESDAKYLGQDGELYGNFHQMRVNLGLKAWERNVTPKKLIELIKFQGLENDPDVMNFMNNWGPEKVSEAINKIASVEVDAERLDRLNAPQGSKILDREATLYS